MVRLSHAQKIIRASLERARALGCPPMTVAVFDARGCLVAFAREDETSLLREDIARAKALGALGMGMGTRALAARAAHHPAFITSLTVLAAGNLVPVPGGVLIRDEDDRIAGAVGISGDIPDRDEECAMAGIAAVGLTGDPGMA